MKITRKQLIKLIRENVFLKEGRFIDKTATYDFRWDDQEFIDQIRSKAPKANALLDYAVKGFFVIVIDKNSLPNMTVEEVISGLKAQNYGGTQGVQHLEPVHDDHPRIKIVEYTGTEFIYQGKRYPVEPDGMPFELCAPEYVDIGDKRATESLTSLQILHKQGSVAPAIKNKCDSHSVVKHINSISDIDTSNIENGIGFERYMRFLEVILKTPGFETYHS
jgi:hypothetical protein